MARYNVIVSRKKKEIHQCKTFMESCYNGAYYIIP